ncbi:Tll0287-like domain-containing protein [Nitrospira sp. Nam74]
MNTRDFWLGLAVGTTLTCLLGQGVFSAASNETDAPKGIPPGVVADYIHSVIQADRTFYSTEIVDRMQARGLVFASEHWRNDEDLPLPAQFVLETGRLVAKQPNGVRFRLISSWPINKRNSPTGDFEQAALREIRLNSDRPYSGVTTDGKTRVFKAVYPDKALSRNCADCHNVHPGSPKRDFKTGDVMGGIVVTIPLPR